MILRKDAKGIPMMYYNDSGDKVIQCPKQVKWYKCLLKVVEQKYCSLYHDVPSRLKPCGWCHVRSWVAQTAGVAKTEGVFACFCSSLSMKRNITQKKNIVNSQNLTTRSANQPTAKPTPKAEQKHWMVLNTLEEQCKTSRPPQVPNVTLVDGWKKSQGQPAFGWCLKPGK